jgi:hypothetical protein
MLTESKELDAEALRGRDIIHLRYELEEAAERLHNIAFDPYKDQLWLHGIVSAGRKLALKFAEIELAQIAYGLGQAFKVWDSIPKRKRPTKIDFKRDYAKDINAACAKWGVAIAHPESGEACTLLVINDKADGRFVLENRATKKRSKTATDIAGLMPLKVVDVSPDAATKC